MTLEKALEIIEKTIMGKEYNFLEIDYDPKTQLFSASITDWDLNMMRVEDSKAEVTGNTLNEVIISLARKVS